MADAVAAARPNRRTTGRDRERSDAFLFFGATGDLAFKQIFPALAGLIRDEHVDLPIVGVARSGDLESLQERARQSLAAHGFTDAAATRALTDRLRYVKGSDDDIETQLVRRADLEPRPRGEHPGQHARDLRRPAVSRA
jgi:glucose-6-phosphate 1-dehydrogenase